MNQSLEEIKKTMRDESIKIGTVDVVSVRVADDYIDNAYEAGRESTKKKAVETISKLLHKYQIEGHKPGSLTNKCVKCNVVFSEEELEKDL